MSAPELHEDAFDRTGIEVSFEEITGMVQECFQVDETSLSQGAPTYYLKHPQETKQSFLKLLRLLDGKGLSAFLKRSNGRIVLTVVHKPAVKPGSAKMFWLLFFATVATTFATGYFMLPAETGISPFLSGFAFSASMLAVLGIHELGHKLAARQRGIAASAPYFVPGPPPLGTLGAVIMQRSLPPNRDALFDVGAAGPVAGFIVALVLSAVGLTLLIPAPKPEGAAELSLMPVSWLLLARLYAAFRLLPTVSGAGEVLLLHPVAYAGWAGMVVTMINLLPAAMLDGGHVARAVASDRQRTALTVLSVALLLLVGPEFYFMALFIILMSMFKHPGPLDDVSGLSRSRKLLAAALLAVFALCFTIRV